MAALLEADREFEGIGAHELNSRWDPQPDEGDVARRIGQFGQLLAVERRLTLLGRAAAAESALYVRRLDGIDIAHWQADAGPWDLARVRQIPTQWIAFKATQSVAYVDPLFRSYRAAARANGFRWVNVYGWLSASTDPAAQAAHLLRIIGGLAVGEAVMLDAEEAGITVEKCLVWLEAVEAVTRRPCSVYTGLYVAGGTIWRDPRIRQSRFGPRPMHLAAYVSVASLLSRIGQLGVAHLPVFAWQWGSDGPVPGITGRCDTNQIIARGAYDLAAGIQATIPIPPEDDMKLRIIANGDNHSDPYRWLTNGLVRVEPTVESLGWLVATGQVEDGQDIVSPEWLPMVVVNSIPLVGSLTEPSSPVACRFDPTQIGLTRCGVPNGVLDMQLGGAATAR